MKVVVRALAIVVLVLAANRCSAGEELRIDPKTTENTSHGRERCESPTVVESALKVRRFDVVPVDDKAILIDTATGATWLLEKLPTSGNRSGHVWQRIPSPFAPPAAVEMREEPSGSIGTISDQSLVPTAPLSFVPPMAPTESPVGPVKLEIKSPSEVAVGETATFVLHVACDEASTLSEMRIQLAPSLEPRLASEDYHRDGNSLAWRDVELLPYRISAHAVQAKATRPDKGALVQCTVTMGGKVFEAQKVVVIQPNPVEE